MSEREIIHIIISVSYFFVSQHPPFSIRTLSCILGRLGSNLSHFRLERHSESMWVPMISHGPFLQGFSSVSTWDKVVRKEVD